MICFLLGRRFPVLLELFLLRLNLGNENFLYFSEIQLEVFPIINNYFATFAHFIPIFSFFNVDFDEVSTNVKCSETSAFWGKIAIFCFNYTVTGQILNFFPFLQVSLCFVLRIMFLITPLA